MNDNNTSQNSQDSQYKPKREMMSLAEILKPFGLSKAAYYQLKYRGYELPAPVGERRSGGRPEKLYYPDEVVAAVERSRSRGSRKQKTVDEIVSSATVEARLRQAFATPVSVREAFAALGLTPGSQQQKHYDLVFRRMVTEGKIVREGNISNRYLVAP